MTYNESKKKATLEYRARSLKRITVDVKTEYYETVKNAAASCNESLSKFVKTAINERMEREGLLPDRKETEEK